MRIARVSEAGKPVDISIPHLLIQLLFVLIAITFVVIGIISSAPLWVTVLIPVGLFACVVASFMPIRLRRRKRI